MSESRGELRATIRDDFVEKSEAEEDFVKEKGCDSLGGDGFLHLAENYPFSKSMVYHDQERIEAGGKGKICDEITGDLLEGMRHQQFDR